MSNNEVACLNTLPTELIYKIFVHLNSETIIRSLRCVCKRLYNIVKTYDQYEFNFQSISKSNFIFLCNYIQLNNIKSLILSDDEQTPGQIEYFLLRYRINFFTQLQSLVLIDIDDCYLKIILNDIKTLKLKNFKIQSQRDYSPNIINGGDFTKVLSLPKLEKFTLKLLRFDLIQIPWPIQCSLQYLEIQCSNLNEYYSIVRHLPNLKKLVLEGLYENINDGIFPKPDDLEGFQQLKYLTLNHCTVDMPVLLIILSLTPMIEEFQLIKSINLDEFISNLSELEKFIEKQLILLNKFEFFIKDRQDFLNTPVDIQSYLTPFQTKFWLSIKEWFVICEYIQSPRTISLYTPSIYDPQSEFYYQTKQITYSSSSPTINNSNSIQMDGVRKIHLNLTQIMPSVTSPQGGIPMNFIFRKVKELTLYTGEQWPLGSLRFISNLVDLSKIEKFTLIIGNSYNLSSESMLNIEKLFQLTKNIHSLKLGLSIRYNININDNYFTQMCRIIPNHVKHLTIQVSSRIQMQNVVHEMKYCSSIKFEYTYYSEQASEILIDWLEHEKGYDTYRLSSNSLSLWLNNYNKRF